MQVLRDGQWQEQDASVLVPGDIISIKLGDIIPADARLLEGDPLKIDQASAQKFKEFQFIINFISVNPSHFVGCLYCESYFRFILQLT